MGGGKKKSFLNSGFLTFSKKHISLSEYTFLIISFNTAGGGGSYFLAGYESNRQLVLYARCNMGGKQKTTALVIFHNSWGYILGKCH